MTFSLVVAATLLSGLLVGLIPTVVDGLKAAVQSRLNLPAHRADWHVSLFYLAWLPAMPLCGWALDLWGSKEILFYSLIALILTLAWLAQARSLPTACTAAFTLGLAYAAVTTTTIHLMTRVFFPEYAADVQMKLASLELGFIAVGFGALLGPAFIHGIERWWGYRQGLIGLGIACILPAALVIISDSTQIPRERGVSISWHTVSHEPHLMMIVGVILLYFAMENCLEFWPEPYLRELRRSERAQRVLMTAFWLAFIAMRGLAAWWLFHHPSQGILWMFAFAFLSALVVGNLAGGYEVGSGTFGFLLAGAVYGPLLPGLLGMAYVVFPDLPASALGGLLALSGLDTLVVRPLMRRFVRDRQPRKVMRVPAILALLLAAPLLLLAFLRD